MADKFKMDDLIAPGLDAIEQHTISLGEPDFSGCGFYEKAKALIDANPLMTMREYNVLATADADLAKITLHAVMLDDLVKMFDTETQKAMFEVLAQHEEHSAYILNVYGNNIPGYAKKAIKDKASDDWVRVTKKVKDETPRAKGEKLD